MDSFGSCFFRGFVWNSFEESHTGTYMRVLCFASICLRFDGASSARQSKRQRNYSSAKPSYMIIAPSVCDLYS